MFHCMRLVGLIYLLAGMNQRQRSTPDAGESGLLEERVLLLVFASIDWDPHVLGRAACVSRKLRAVAKRILWRELCLFRAPRIVNALISGASGRGLSNGWDALAKIFFYCCGCVPSSHFAVGRTLPGHFVGASRFSKTSGKSFLGRRCREDLLYVSDPCEHNVGSNEDDVGVYRGVFREFLRSRTRASLIKRGVQLEATVRCPYCGVRVWSMTEARLVPRSASRRLGSRDEKLDYFVCINGHLHGACLLAHLSSDVDSDDNDDNDNDDDDDDDDDDKDLAMGGGSV